MGLVAVLIALAWSVAPQPVGAQSEPSLQAELRCQARLGAAGSDVVRRRVAAVERCVQKALRCPDALSPDAGAGPNACLTAVADACRTRLAPALAAKPRLPAALLACTAPPPGLGVSVAFILEEDGLGFGRLAEVCGTAVEDGPSLLACQWQALACAVDGLLATGMPRLTELLAKLGHPFGAPGRCVGDERCGDAIVDDDEECDQGADNSDVTPDACRTTCEAPTCGDGVVDTDEECDDGNDDDADGCESDCTPTPPPPSCGDGFVDEEEECDDGPANSDVTPDACRTRCQEAACGDRVTDSDEECDDGALNSDLIADRCRTTCEAPSCGDGVVDGGETCEPPGTLLCGNDCRIAFGAPFERRAARASGGPLEACQAAFVRGAVKTAGKWSAALRTCVAATLRCRTIDDERDPDGRKLDACLARAGRGCAALTSLAERLDRAAVGRVGGRCPGVDAPGTLLGSQGLAFAEVADGCLDGAPATLPALVACVQARARCLAERAVARTVPRISDVFFDLDVDLDIVRCAEVDAAAQTAPVSASHSSANGHGP